MRSPEMFLGALAAGIVMVVSSCDVTARGIEGSTIGDGNPVTGLRIMVPNTPGGGYDTTARAVAKVMEDAELADGVQVFNLPGASGTVGLQRTVDEKGNGKLAMQIGLGVVGASYTSHSTATQTTPIAKLIEEAAAIVVPKDVDAGQVRVLAVTSKQPISVLRDVPTLTSSGIDLAFTNWRGIVAPPGISQADKMSWINVMTAMHDSELWRNELTKRGWTDSFLTGEKFSVFLREQDKVVAGILTELDLA